MQPNNDTTVDARSLPASRPRRLVSFFLVLSLVLLVPPRFSVAQESAHPAAAPAQTAENGNMTADQARRALDVLQNDARRREVIDALRAIAQTAPASGGTSAPAASSPATASGTAGAAAPTAGTPAAAPGTGAPSPAAAAPAAGAAAAPAAADPDKVSLRADGLLAQLLLAMSGWLTAISAQMAAAGRALSNVPLIWDWVVRTATNPFAQSTVLNVGWRLALVLLLAWTARRLTSRALRRPMAALIRRARGKAEERQRIKALNDGVVPDANSMASRAELRFLRRFPLAILRLVLELIPIAVFAAVGNLLLATPLNDGWTVPLVILAAVNAYVIQHVIMAFGRMLVSPDCHELRLFRMTDETAAYSEVWLARISRVAIYGFAVLQIARVLGLYEAAYIAATRLVVLVNHLLMAVVVLQCRRGVAEAIAAPHGATGVWPRVRNRLASVWHIAAVFLLLALWFVWAVEIQNGYSLLLRYFGATILVLVVARLVGIGVIGLLDRVFRIQPEMAEKLPFLEARANRYYPLLRRLVSTLLTVISILAVLQVWGIDALAWFQDGRLGERVAGSVLVVLIAAAVALAIWELANGWVEREISGMVARGEFARSARLRTLLPLLRSTLLTLILVVVGFTALSQLGVNIAPLLAGASIIGVALGFGSQKLVQDVITGMFLLLENTMQVGDWVTVSGLSGSVEALSIRTIRLRAGDGSVHVVPFSAVTTVTNTNRGVGNAAVSVTVAYHEDTDRVGEVLKEIGAALRTDPAFRDSILDDFALWGVDKVDGATATVLGQMKCKDTGRWGVQREFNRRIKMRFQEEGIQIAVPSQGVILSRPEPRLREDQEPAVPALTEGGSGARKASPPPSALGNTQ
ncbi:mechanosensitive ion channel domain-containing protein [Roseomonas elaeocarpi]|uniref:Mechanosensitive ion channel domain-containing protein n=1 Tax=Roseomonas elaeocarpi TaxID=907779 RepID=A0ABV6K209_9PROT